MSNKEEIGAAEWIPKVNVDTNEYSSEQYEGSMDKLIRKCKESPGVPLGLLATTSALTYGLYQFKKGNSMKQQYAMRARVTFQGLTLAAVVFSLWIARANDMKKRGEEKS
ncbi:HIG1 domain family member 2A, mitochondrial [Leptopilina heterotoma]|uniref:HIG1 domain family member 2A, mitochondrial n=1 Tax=Leptopilina heterotoma TaxID=63436 RepID=UPI001CA9E8B9|nr:HIG1 domain family member 2A, mitochondrial [Leptopilina heterotoma]